MSQQDYQDSMSLASEPRATFETLIMAALRKGHSGQMNTLKEAFPQIYEEFHYRYWSGGGKMPGEEGYDPVTDDNLPIGGE
jgi:hypothetical protein